MMKKLLLAGVLLAGFVAGGCAPTVETLGKMGARLWVQQVNAKVIEAELKLSAAQETAFGDAVYGWGEQAVEDVEDLIDGLKND